MSFGNETFDPVIHDICEECQGEGGWLVEAGIYFSEMQEVWMPDERFEPCPECIGKGFYDKETFEKARKRK